MKKGARRIGLVLLLAVFLVSTALLAGRLRDNAAGAGAYDTARAMVTRIETPPEPVRPPAAAAEPEAEPEQAPEPVPMKTIWIPAPVEDDPHMAQLSGTDLSALQAVNPHVLGWILIPDSVIDFPLLQGTDNTHYLHHTWDGQKNSVGSIFLEHKNAPDLTDYNTIVYGHNMNDGAMFAGLKDFSDEAYRQAHPYVYIAAGEQILRYEIFSCYRAGLEDPTYGLSFRQQTTKEAFLAHAAASSVIDTGITPAVTDRILTLSTCFGDGSNTRWVVHARLEMIPMEVPAE